MNKTTSITFAVSDVPPAETLLDEEEYQAVLKERVEGAIEDCSFQEKCLVPCDMHPFVLAVHHAFADHRPLVISPDHIWLLICHGFANHINQNSETFRRKLVHHEGKKELVVIHDEFRRGRRANDWDGVIDEIVGMIRQDLRSDQQLLRAEFSTTSRVEKTAFEVALMDAMKHYFGYMLVTRCGIPTVTLKGTPEDWQIILDELQALRQYDLEWWIDALSPIIEKLVFTSRGNIDPAFWQAIYKRSDASGGPYIRGWIIKFFPYLVESVVGPEDLITFSMQINPYITKEPQGFFQGVTTDAFPPGLSRVPFTWQYLDQTIPMALSAGFIGIEQDHATKALYPEIGWAVTERSV